MIISLCDVREAIDGQVRGASSDMALWPRIRQAIYAAAEHPDHGGDADLLLDLVAESVHAELLCREVSGTA